MLGEKQERLHMGKWTRLERISGMEIGDKVFCMVRFHGGKPREFVISVFITKLSDKVE